MCDNCENGRREGGPSSPMFPTAPSASPSRISRPNTPTSPRELLEPSSVHSTPSKSRNPNGKRQMVPRDGCGDETPTGPATRRGQHLKNVRTALETWRVKLRNRKYPSSPFTPATLLPNSTLTTLASNARIKTPNDMVALLNPPWFLAARHGQEVIDLLAKLDADDKENREREKLERREAKKQETARLREARRSQKTHERSQASASTPARALASSSTFNSAGEPVRSHFAYIAFPIYATVQLWTYPQHSFTSFSPSPLTPSSSFTPGGNRTPSLPTHAAPSHFPHPHHNHFALPCATPPRLPPTYLNPYYPYHYNTPTSSYHRPNPQNPSDDFLPVASTPFPNHSHLNYQPPP